MQEKQLRPEDMPQDSFTQDLHPDRNAGINHGELGNNPEQRASTAYEITELHNVLKDFTDDELRRIVVLPEGARLEQGATYIDLSSGQRTEFTGTSAMKAGHGSYIVPKSEVEYTLWNRLIGVDNPERRTEPRQ